MHSNQVLQKTIALDSFSAGYEWRLNKPSTNFSQTYCGQGRHNWTIPYLLRHSISSFFCKLAHFSASPSYWLRGKLWLTLNAGLGRRILRQTFFRFIVEWKTDERNICYIVSISLLKQAHCSTHFFGLLLCSFSSKYWSTMRNTMERKGSMVIRI